MNLVRPRRREDAAHLGRTHGATDEDPWPTGFGGQPDEPSEMPTDVRACAATWTIAAMSTQSRRERSRRPSRLLFAAAAQVPDDHGDQGDREDHQG